MSFQTGIQASSTKSVEEWEEWEEDDAVTPIDAGEQVRICPPPEPVYTRAKPDSVRSSKLSTSKIRRLRSRQRQKAQNAKAGIRLITDMSALRRHNHIAHHMRSPNGRPGKFVDAAALRALEGEPNSASVGNWNWLKRNNGKSPNSSSPETASRPNNQELSPEDRPIMIGISMLSKDMNGREISPHVATIGSSQSIALAAQGRAANASSEHTAAPATPGNASRSMWSPETPETLCSFDSPRAPSSLYSQGTVYPASSKGDRLPPVPALPVHYEQTPIPPREKALSLEPDSPNADADDTGTPCTLFEEDGQSSPRRQHTSKTLSASPDSAGSRSHGWWDHVITPFVDKRMSFSSRRQRLELPSNPSKRDDMLWIDEKTKPEQAAPLDQTPNIAPVAVIAPIVRAPAPKRIPSPKMETTATAAAAVPRAKEVSHQALLHNPRNVVTRDSTISDHPPPYSPPKKEYEKPVRYRAVFPPGHPLHGQFPPTPRPASPGLAGTMTSQRAHVMPHINVCPTAVRRENPPVISEPLPSRPVGTILPGEHVHSVQGPTYRVERQRRRHEKEEVIARRFGGFWRGRGCMPSRGCFGRTGREGRKRRRVWMAIWAGIIALLILMMVLAVVLTRNHGAAEAPSIWVNLTDFPPMPTGVLTVVAPDNTDANSGCTSPSTLWSCSLPKEQHESVAPYKANQPTVVMQIQWDNSTQRAWDVPNGPPPTQVSRRAVRAFSRARGVLSDRGEGESFQSVPGPPQFQEMWFLGETTDGIKSGQKGGEPAPFYISLIKSVNGTVSQNKLKRRDSSSDIGNTTFKHLIPAPDLEKDGTSVPAVLLPNPAQQPVRLYDRGLPTEHYGFYTYFKRTLFLKSVKVQNQTEQSIPLDEDGGCRKTQASHLVTWGEARLLVQIWTRRLEDNSTATSLLKPDNSRGIGGTGRLVRPGTMPYPVTVTMDTHGGNPDKKLVWDRSINDRLQVSTDTAEALPNDMAVGGTWINRRGDGDAKFGGFDGGTGGCRCQWVNWV